MSEVPDRDLLAAEYVLGSLAADEVRAVERMLEADPAFRGSVEAWQRRLTPLSAIILPTEPPTDLWRRIELSTATKTTSTVSTATENAGNVVSLRRLRFWQAGAAGAFALAASIAAFMMLRQPALSPVAVLTPMGAPAMLLVISQPGSATLRIRPNGTITVPNNRDLELWALPQGETQPHSLGVFSTSGQEIIADLAVGTQLLVSLEPRGGSPTSQPTGPVLYAGLLTN